MTCSLACFGMGAAANFAPLSLLPKVWLRSDLGIVAPGNVVSSWADQSGNGFNVAAAPPGPAYNTAGGANGRPRLTWTSGMGQYLKNAVLAIAMQPVESFVVATLASLPSTNTCLHDLGNLNDIPLLQGGATDFSTYNAGFGVNSPGASVVVGTPFVADTEFQTTAQSVTINGSRVGTGPGSSTAQAGTGFYIGTDSAAQTWVGDIYEVFIFTRILQSAERTALLAYLTKLYGIT
jgi:hypothetical protein